MVHCDVDFVVVGGVCGFLHGAAVSTFDLDIVHSRTPENVAAVLKALDQLGAYSKLHPKKLKPNASHVDSPGHLLLKTKFGDLDIWGSIAGNDDYQSLIGDTQKVSIQGVPLRMLTLEKLIQTKFATDRPKDRLVIPILRAVIDERDNRPSTKHKKRARICGPFLVVV